MKPSFDIWAQAEIVRLRAEADALEHSLSLYQRAIASGENKLLASAPSQSVSEAGPRARKHGDLLRVWISAGAKGMTFDEMEACAEMLGSPINRNSLRGFVHHWREAGKAKSVSGRHFWTAEIEEGEPSAHQAESSP